MKKLLYSFIIPLLILSCSKDEVTVSDPVIEHYCDSNYIPKYATSGNLLLNSQSYKIDELHVHENHNNRFDISIFTLKNGYNHLALSFNNLTTLDTTYFKDTLEFNHYISMTNVACDALYCNMTEKPSNLGWALCDNSGTKKFSLKSNALLFLESDSDNSCLLLNSPNDSIKVELDVVLTEL